MTMDPRLQAWLDGDVGFDDLPEELRPAASAWTRLLEEVRELPAPGSAPDAPARVLASIREAASAEGGREGAPEGGGVGAGAAVRWLFRPRAIRLPPLAAAAILVLAAWGGIRLGGAAIESGPGAGAAGPDAPPTARAESGAVYVQFVMSAPGARSVALAGDFNEWTPSVALEDPDGDGVWTGRVALEAGVHEYMFVIDGTEWRPDPNALSYTDDGFGRRNSVLAVAPLDRT